MSKQLYDISKEDLIDLYVKKGMTVSDVSKVYGCGADAIRKRMEKYGISRRPRGDKVTIQKETLVDLYINRHLTADAVAKQLGCSSKTVSNKLKKCGIKPLTNPKAMPQQVDISKSRLTELYIGWGMSIAKIAQLLDCGRP